MNRGGGCKDSGTFKLLGVPAESSGPGQDSPVDQRTLLGVTGTFFARGKSQSGISCDRCCAWAGFGLGFGQQSLD